MKVNDFEIILIEQTRFGFNVFESWYVLIKNRENEFYRERRLKGY